MREHYVQALKICNRARQIDGVSRILLYGSVARGEERRDSDVDIAIVFDNFDKALPLDEIGFPKVEVEQIEQIGSEIQKRSGIRNHLVFYWEDEYGRGVFLDSNKYPGRDSLNSSGRTLFHQ